MFNKITLFFALALFCILEHAVSARQILRGPTMEFARFGDMIDKRKIARLQKFMAHQVLNWDQAFHLDQASYDAYVIQLGESLDGLITAMAADPTIPVQVTTVLQQQRDSMVTAKQTGSIADYKNIMESIKFIMTDMIGLPGIVATTYKAFLDYLIAQYGAMAMMAPL